MKKIITLNAVIVVILVISLSYNYYIKKSETISNNNFSKSTVQDIKNEIEMDNIKNNDSENNSNDNITEMLEKVKQAHEEIECFSSEICIIVNDLNGNVENIKIDVSNDAVNNIKYIQLNDLNLNIVPLKAYYLDNVLYINNYYDNKWVSKKNEELTVEYKDFDIDLNFEVTDFLDTSIKNLVINEGLSDEKHIVLEAIDKFENISDERYLVNEVKGTIWIDSKEFYIDRILLENKLREKDSQTFLQEMIMDIKINGINESLEIKIPEELMH